MRLELTPGSRVLIDLRATGLLRAVGHSPTLAARPQPFSIEPGPGDAPGVAPGGRLDLPVQARFAAGDIEPPNDIPPSDREQMRENLLGRDVLDAARFPTVEFRGRYVGTLEGGRLSGDLSIRGAERPIAFDVRIERAGAEGAGAGDGGAGLRVRGAWEGRLTQLGIKPFRALLGALRLDDWIRLRLEASFAHR